MAVATAPAGKRTGRRRRDVRAIGAIAHRIRVQVRTDYVTEGDGATRTRFRGQSRRGGLATGAAAAQLVYQALVELGEAHRTLLKSDEIPDWQRRDRDDVRAEAWRHVDLAERLLVNARLGRKAEQ